MGIKAKQNVNKKRIMHQIQAFVPITFRVIVVAWPQLWQVRTGITG
jgi:hypothetical protein